MINWEVVLWTCITLAVIMGVIAMILTFISARNMKKRRAEVGLISAHCKKYATLKLFYFSQRV